MRDQKLDIKSMTLPELSDYFKTLGQPAFRAGQVFSWLHKGAVASFDEMTDLPKALRARLAEEALIAVPETIRIQRSEQDGTVKALRGFGDALVESVFMRYHHGNSVCISTQSGCRMGCAFCASGQNGLSRNLTASEMLAQIQWMAKEEGPVSSVVLMGTGEPLDNYDNTLRFLALVHDPMGMGLSHRHISLSTCGLADKIERLAEEKLQITLSVSLHAPFDEIRDRLMPVNRAFPLGRLMAACRAYQEKTGRRISFEYAMIEGINDTFACADELARLIRGMGAHVNLIPLNRVAESEYQGSGKDRVRAFQQRLERRGVNATVRRKLGPDIDASCGQLRNRVKTEERDDHNGFLGSD